MKKTDKQFKKEVFDLVGDEYTVLGNYSDWKTKIKIKHNRCQTEFFMKPNDFLNGCRCPFCAKEKRKRKTQLTIDNYKKIIKEKYGDEYSILSDSYNGQKTKILIRHNKCGEIYTATARNLLRGMGCKKCSYEKSAEKLKGRNNNLTKCKTIEQFKKEVFDLVGDEYTVLGNYINNKTPIIIKHNTCGNIYSVLPLNFLTGQRCPKCTFKNGSKEENDLFDFVSSIYKGKIERNYRIYDENNKSIFKEADIFIPELNFAIEFNGLYWHCEAKIPNKNYHIEKTMFFRDRGIRLIQIFEDEWLHKNDIVKNKIAHIMKCSQNEIRIYARKCEIREVDSTTKDIFLEKYHIQGKDRSQIKVGLYFNNELVSIMTFCKPRLSLGRKSSGEGEYELLRFASSCSVIGAFSKLLDYSIKNYNIKAINTFADLRWSSMDNNVYEKNGFKLMHISEPNYWYIAPGETTRRHRFVFQKQALKNKFPEIYSDDKTEVQIMYEAKYNRIWDCGNLVFRMEIK